LVIDQFIRRKAAKLQTILRLSKSGVMTGDVLMQPSGGQTELLFFLTKVL
jgi:hypothetical protein